MTISLNGRLDEQAHILQATSVAALTAAGAYVSLKGYRRATIVVSITNGATPTGAAISLQQATAVAGTGQKTLGFTRMLANIDVGAGAAPANYTETAVSSNTFTTDATANKRLQYIFEVDAESLDVANGFDCFRVNCASGATMTGVVLIILWGARYIGANPMVD